MMIQNVKVWNFDLPAFPRAEVTNMNMSPECQVNRLIRYEAGRLARINQLDLIGTAEELKAFQSALRQKLWNKLGTTYDASIPLAPRYLGTVPQKGFRIEKVMYCSEPGVWVTGLLYVPEGKGPFPAVLLMHGHNPEGKFAASNQTLAANLAMHGIVCLSVDARGTYERATECRKAEYHGGVLGASVFNTGETLMGQQVVDNMRGIDFLQSLDFVIKDRIGATGASGGGNQTLWLSALDERIIAAMPVVCVGSFEAYAYGINCVCELLPDVLTFTEVSGVLALICPRMLRIGNALYDGNHDFSVGEMLKSFTPVKKIYQKLGVPQNIAYTIADRHHGYSDLQREAAWGHFLWALKGEGSGAPVAEYEYDLPAEETLHLFKKPEDRPDLVAPIRRINRRKGAVLRQKMLETETFSAETLRAGLRKLLRLREQPAAYQLYRYAAQNGVKRFVLEAGDHLIPFLYYEGGTPGKICIVLHPEGKAALTEEDFSQVLAQGYSLVLPDLFGTGETALPSGMAGVHHQFFRQLLWIGRSLMGEWIFDLLALREALQKELDAGEIVLLGVKEAGTAALLANALCSGFARVIQKDAPATLLSEETAPEKNFFTIAVNIPDFLPWGDLTLAEVLGYGSVVSQNLRDLNGVGLTAEEQQKRNGELEMLRRKLF